MSPCQHFQKRRNEAHFLRSSGMADGVRAVFIIPVLLSCDWMQRLRSDPPVDVISAPAVADSRLRARLVKQQLRVVCFLCFGCRHHWLLSNSPAGGRWRDVGNISALQTHQQSLLLQIRLRVLSELQQLSE